MSLPLDKQARKERPMARGLLAYFPDALAEVAHVSYIANEQHNPGEPMHWARGKSDDHADCLIRHLAEHGSQDDDGLLHTAKVAWRALALLQLELEARAGVSPTSSGTEEATEQTAEESVDTRLDVRYHGDMNTRDQDQGTPTLPDNLTPGQAEAVFKALTHTMPLTMAQTVIGGISAAADATDASILERPWVYIAGPMTGKPLLNFPVFNVTRDQLRHAQFNVINPADIDISQADANAGLPAAHYAKRDIAALQWIRWSMDHFNLPAYVCMLPGWEESTGATAEFFLARWLGLDFLWYDEQNSRQPLTKINGRCLLESLSRAGFRCYS